MSLRTTLLHAGTSGEALVLTKAVIRAGRWMELSQRELGEILGRSPASISRLYGGRLLLDPGTKDGELALLFLRIFRSLDALLGGSQEGSRAWLRSENHHLGGIPLERMKTVTGLVDVASYLDAMRGKT